MILEKVIVRRLAYYTLLYIFLNFYDIACHVVAVEHQLDVNKLIAIIDYEKICISSVAVLPMDSF